MECVRENSSHTIKYSFRRLLLRNRGWGRISGAVLHLDLGPRKLVANRYRILKARAEAFVTFESPLIQWGYLFGHLNSGSFAGETGVLEWSTSISSLVNSPF